MKKINTLYKLILKYFGFILINMEFPRFSTEEIKKTFGNKELVGVEIGVSSGNNAKSILQNLNIKKLYLIDPYKNYLEWDDSDGMYTSQKNLNKKKQKAKKKLRDYSDKIIWIEKKSEDVLNDIPNNLDFVYIDGNHRYKFVKQDIENYYPKLKKGGILAGHDFNEFEIVKAVFEFISKNKLVLHNVKRKDWIILR